MAKTTQQILGPKRAGRLKAALAKVQGHKRLLDLSVAAVEKIAAMPQASRRSTAKTKGR